MFVNKEGKYKMFDAVTQKPINEEENKIRKQIEELKKQLPRKKARGRKLPDFITFEEYNKFLKGLNDRKLEKEYTLCAVLGFEAGMRLSEMVGYKNNKSNEWIVPPLIKEQIDLQRHTIKIISGKGGKDRIVPLPKSFNERALKLIPITKNRRTIQRFFSKYTKLILGRNLSIHKFRHGFGSRLANQNVPIHQIQMWMGHSRLDTTGIYLHANPKQAVDGAREVF